MAFRVREVLLVSSRYDAFVLEEDGHLGEQVLMEYKSLSLALSTAPRFVHVSTMEEALQLLDERHFDLVLLVAREASREVTAFVQRIKRKLPAQRVAVLGFETANLSRLLPEIGPYGLEAVFAWTGDAKILLAMVKSIEDRANVDRDIQVAGVRAILVVEDSVRAYSAFLGVLYPELMKQTQFLYAEGLNRLQRPLRMRTRPKILHARELEQALALFDRYRDHVIGVISDVGFPREGRLDPRAGIALVRHVRACVPDMPILLQSAETDLTAEARAHGVHFVPKDSPALLHTLRGFLTDYLGFGPFIFRLPDGREVARASDARELVARLESLPAASLAYHSERNHFSNWLMARSEFELAESLRPLKVSDFESTEAVREHLVRTLNQRLARVRRGVIADFRLDRDDRDSLVLRIGDGSLGGKARGLAFLNQVLSEEAEDRLPPGLAVRIPQTFAVAVEHFERFLEENRLFDALGGGVLSDEQIHARFQAARMPQGLLAALAALAERVRGPLAVRSSSLLEDDMLHPFAGVYDTVMIPNSAPRSAERLADLQRAVAAVYASAFFRDARAYLTHTGHRVEEEHMGVVIQRVVGRAHGSRFYPDLAGVAQAYDFYPVGPWRPSDGVAQAALGLGRLVVEGGACVRFCPRRPAERPQMASPRLALRNSQRFFYALDLARPWRTGALEVRANQQTYDLSVALEDGPFRMLGGVVSAVREEISDDPETVGTRVVTLSRLLADAQPPLAGTLAALLDVVSEAMGAPVEMEWACDLASPGQACLYLLQVRPILVRDEASDDLDPEGLSAERLIGRSSRALGHGSYTGIRDLILVKPGAYQPAQAAAIAQEIGALNERLVQERRPYVLIGPGRWGTADPWLGIPVQWPQISGARIIVEASPAGHRVEPSQGSHFFHNLTALRLGYLTIPPGATREAPIDGDFLDWDWLLGQPAASDGEHLRLVRLPHPLIAHLDGRHGLGLLARPADEGSATAQRGTAATK
jgi:hypothetical protein